MSRAQEIAPEPGEGGDGGPEGRLPADDYDPGADSIGCYDLWVATQRAKLLQERCPAARRVEVIGGCELYLGDCLEILGALEPVDHLISDPPYEQESQDRIGGIRRNDGGKVTEKLTFAGIDGIRDEVCQATARLCHGWGIFFCTAEGVALWRDAIEAADVKYKTACIWVKPDAMPKFSGTGPAIAFESIVTCWNGAGRAVWNGGGKRGIYTHLTNQRDRDGRHPTEKPVPLMVEIVQDFTRAGQTILDPFMGSGTTGVACVRTGRRFIGIEQDEKFFDVAVQRIRKAFAQPDLFIAPPPPKAEQIGLAFEGGGDG